MIKCSYNIIIDIFFCIDIQYDSAVAVPLLNFEGHGRQKYKKYNNWLQNCFNPVYNKGKLLGGNALFAPHPSGSTIVTA